MAEVTDIERLVVDNKAQDVYQDLAKLQRYKDMVFQPVQGGPTSPSTQWDKVIDALSKTVEGVGRPKPIGEAT